MRLTARARKILITVGIVFGLILLVVASLSLVVRIPFIQAELRSRIESELYTQLDREVEIGDVRLGLFLRSLDIRNIRIIRCSLLTGFSVRSVTHQSSSRSGSERCSLAETGPSWSLRIASRGPSLTRRSHGFRRGQSIEGFREYLPGPLSFPLTFSEVVERHRHKNSQPLSQVRSIHRLPLAIPRVPDPRFVAG